MHFTSKNVKWCHLIWPTLYNASVMLWAATAASKNIACGLWRANWTLNHNNLLYWGRGAYRLKSPGFF